MKKLKFNDFYPNSDDEAITIIKTYLRKSQKNNCTKLQQA